MKQSQRIENEISSLKNKLTLCSDRKRAVSRIKNRTPNQVNDNIRLVNKSKNELKDSLGRGIKGSRKIGTLIHEVDSYKQKDVSSDSKMQTQQNYLQNEINRLSKEQEELDYQISNAKYRLGVAKSQEAEEHKSDSGWGRF